MDIQSFDDLDLTPEVLDALKRMKLTIPTTVQRLAIPILMEGYPLIAKAPTGTGKTFAFGIPLLEYLSMDQKQIQDVILCPTRELALQIRHELEQLGCFIDGFRIAALIGGQPMDQQIQELKQYPQIIVATPGRLLDHMRRRNVTLSEVKTVILDEADEMLSMGFIDDIRKILSATPKEKQMAMFSATMSRDVMDISWQYMHGAKQIEVKPEKDDLPQIDQVAITVPEKDKIRLLVDLMQEKNFAKALVFCNTKNQVRRVTALLKQKDFEAEELHGDIVQRRRIRIMAAFRKGRYRLLIATDVAARGLDICDVDAVFNYDVPLENEYYLHRIGRTGRAKQKGVSYTFVTFVDRDRMDQILRYNGATPQWLKHEDVMSPTTS